MTAPGRAGSLSPVTDYMSIQPGDIIEHSGETFNSKREVVPFSERHIVLKRHSQRLYLAREGTGELSTLNRRFVTDGDVIIVGHSDEAFSTDIVEGTVVRIDKKDFNLVGLAQVTAVNPQMRTADIVMTSGDRNGLGIRRMSLSDLQAA